MLNRNVLNRRKNRRARSVPRAFTLIELLIVITILLALGGLVLVNVLDIAARSKIDLQQAQFDQIEAAIEQFRFNLDRWPTEDETIAALWNRELLEEEEDSQRWQGPYLKSPVTEDRWGNELIYRNPSEELGDAYYDLVSIGPDHEEGTEDDITNPDRLRDEEGELPEELTDFTPADTGAAP